MPRPARLEPHDLASLRLPMDARLSPDGRSVVFVEQRLDWERDATRRGLRRIDVESGQVTTWTDGAHRDESPMWLADSRTIVFVSDRGDVQGLWRLRDGEPQLLVRLPGRITSPRPSPDGRRIAFLYTPPGTTTTVVTRGAMATPAARVRRIVRHGYKREGIGYRDGAYTHVWVFDMATRRTRAVTTGDWDDIAFDWSPDGRRLVFVSNRIPRADVQAENSDLFVVGAGGGTPRPLTRFRGPKHAPAWSPDGRTIAFIGHARFPDAVENMHVWVVPASGGKARDLMDGIDLDCSDALITDVEDAPDLAPAPLWSPRGDRLFALASRDGAVNVWEVGLRGGLVRQRSFGRHGIRSLSQSRDGRHWAFVRRDATEPGDVWLVTATGATARPALDAGRPAAANASIASLPVRPEYAIPGARVERATGYGATLRKRRHLVVPEPFAIPCTAGHTVHGWMLRGQSAPRRGPLVIMLHGGPYSMSGWSYMHEFQVLAQRGYHVASVNLRGSIGYGRDFMRALFGTWGSRDFEDLMRVADVLEGLSFVDPERIGLSGGSYGGYLAAWAISHTRRFAAAIASRGIYNLPSMLGTSDTGPELLQEFEGQAPWESIERWWRVSPLAYAGNIRTPLLLLHAESDLRCPISQAEELFTALRLQDRDVEFVRFLGENHHLSRSGRPQSRVARLQLIADWFDRKL